MGNDLECQDHGALVLLYARSKAGDAWMHHNLIEGDEALSFGGGLALDHCDVSPVVKAAIRDGLQVAIWSPRRRSRHLESVAA